MPEHIERRNAALRQQADELEPGMIPEPDASPESRQAVDLYMRMLANQIGPDGTVYVFPKQAEELRRLLLLEA
jgi:hypothetical protein